MAKKKKGKRDDSKLMGALAYLLGLLTGLIIYLIKGKDKYARFHAVQSIILNIVLMVLLAIPFILLLIAGFALAYVTSGYGLLIIPIGMLILLFPVFILTVYCMWKAYSGERFKLPLIGNFAKKYAD